MSLSLMNAQMMRVISSPSSSTTGFFTLIFAIGGEPYLALRSGLDPGERLLHPLLQALDASARQQLRHHAGVLAPCLGQVGAAAGCLHRERPRGEPPTAEERRRERQLLAALGHVDHRVREPPDRSRLVPPAEASA